MKVAILTALSGMLFLGVSMQSLAETNRWAGYTGVDTQRYQHRPYSPQHRPLSAASTLLFTATLFLSTTLSIPSTTCAAVGAAHDS